ncbi:MAG TPA: hypothetical protein PK239_17485 [Chitinophagales bacterium]|nr:hypothetical protein [Chitinophagales bacterium]
MVFIFLFLSSLSMALFSCTSPNKGESGKKKSSKSEIQEVQIVVKLTNTATIDSLVRLYADFKMQPIQALSAQDNMWYVSAKVGNGYALVENMRKNPIVEAAELSNATLPTPPPKK